MNFCLTNAGKEYMAKVNAGELKMHLTKVVTGSGHSSSLEILTGVVDERQQIQLDDVTSEGEYTYISCVLTNLELNQGYVLKQIGLYAVDNAGAEVLIIIGQDDYGDRIPVLSEKEVEYQYNIGMRVSNAAEVTFDFSINDFLRKKYFYEHLEEFEQYKKNIQNQFKALPKVKVGPAKELDRRDTILFETLKDTNKVIKIWERDAEDILHEYDLAAVFDIPETREMIKSKDSLSKLFGKIGRYLSDLKQGTFKEADDPFVLMTVNTYKAPDMRLKGSLYGLITKDRGVIIICFDRYVQGLEEPRKERTLYGVEVSSKTGKEKSVSTYIGILDNIIFLDDNISEREPYRIYGKIKAKKG